MAQHPSVGKGLRPFRLGPHPMILSDVAWRGATIVLPSSCSGLQIDCGIFFG